MDTLTLSEQKLFLPAELSMSNRQPSDAEAEIARTVISLFEDTLRDIRSWACGSDSIEKEHRDSELRVTQALGVVKRIVAPIRRVPEEIFRKIFLTYVDCNYFPSITTQGVPLVLTQISSGLRHIALTTPELWTGLHMYVSVDASFTGMTIKMLKAKKRMMQEWLARSGTLPLNISVIRITPQYPKRTTKNGVDPEELYRELLDIVLECHPRWRYIKLRLDTFEERTVSFLQALKPEDVPQLRAFDIDIALPPIFSKYNFWANFMASPKLTTISGISISHFSQHKSSLPLSRITHLTCEGKLYGPSEPALIDFALALSECVSLVSLDLSLNCVGSNSNDLPVIDLPALQDLHIEERIERKYGLMVAINAPLLESLNVHFFKAIDISFFRRASNITELNIDQPVDKAVAITILRQFPQLVVLGNLDLVKQEDSDWARSWDTLMGRFVDADNTGDVLCPQLQYLELCSDKYGIPIHNFDTLRALITRKLEPSPNLAPWKRLSLWFQRGDAEVGDDILEFRDPGRIDIVPVDYCLFPQIGRDPFVSRWLSL